MNTLLLAAVNAKLVISTVAYILPWVLVVVLVAIGIVNYIKNKGLSASTLMSVAGALFDNPTIRKWFDEEINQAIVIVAESIAKKANQTYEGTYDAVLKYVNAALLALLQTVETAIDNAEGADEIYNILKKYKIDVDNVENLSAYVISMLGYNETNIRNMIETKVKDLTTV